ncbi:MAG: flavodoxin [Chloroflexi bacterium]|nr:flavodoxin [Chloroflexota bacterium]
MPLVLIVFDSRGGLIEKLAGGIAKGVSSVPGVTARLSRIEETTKADLEKADAIVLGSPNWTGITGKMKSWMDGLGDLWSEGQIKDKLGAAFTAGSSKSAGIEPTLLMLIHWMIAGGMIIVGLPWNEGMRTTGSYYGATAAGTVQEADLEQARALGKRVAELTLAKRR